MTRESDSYSWGCENERSKTFSTKKNWTLIRPREDQKYWIPKHSFTFWTAHLDRLLVKVRLRRWGMNINTTCSLNEETREHMFLHCDYSYQVWKLFFQRLGQPQFIFSTWNSLISWLLTRSTDGTSTLLKRLASQATVFLLWKEWNNRIHNVISLTPANIFRQIDCVIRDTLLARHNRKGCNSLLS